MEKTTEKPERVHLGTTSVQISPLGIGTWAWGDRVMWGYRDSYSDEDLEEAFHATLDAGINLFDTAEVYGLGKSERLLGQFINSNRSNVVVATKFAPFPFRLGKRSFRCALRQSLRRLGLDHVDLYQMHWPSPPMPLEHWMDAMADAVDVGLIRAVGVSNYNVTRMSRAYNALAKRGIKLAANQVHYSLLHRDPEFNGVQQLCNDLNVTMIAYSPLEMGILTGKYSPDNPLPGIRGLRYSQDYLAKAQTLLKHMEEIGQAHGGKSLAQVALNWTICKGSVPIPGAKNTRHVISNAGALGWRLTDDEIASLDAASML